jgi:hypothetical protein
MRGFGGVHSADHEVHCRTCRWTLRARALRTLARVVRVTYPLARRVGLGRQWCVMAIRLGGAVLGGLR